MFFYLLLMLVILIYFVSTRKYGYWKKKNVPHIKPTFILGNYGDWILMKKSISEVVQDLCEKFPNERFFGAYIGTEPVLIPKDPEIIKLIVTKDFYYFNGRDLSEHNHKEPGARNLLFSHGDNWKVLRQNMTPLFSTAKIKNMFYLIENCCYAFESMLDREVGISSKVLCEDLTARYTVECIVSCAFGVDANTMSDVDVTDNPFKKMTRFLDPPKIVGVIRYVRLLWPTIFYGLGFQVVGNQIKFFDNLISNVMKTRNYKPSGRNDFVDIILNWKQGNKIVGDSMKNFKSDENVKVAIDVDNDLLLAQCLLFFNAGFGTSSSTLSFTFYELAKHEEIQDKVLAEVDAFMARHENKLTFDCLTELPYLEAVISEALRLHPILGMINREVMEDYILPGGVKLNKGLRVHLPVYYLHHNPEYFPEPEQFRPERFLGEEKKNINPYTYLPFGEGPRTCIGMRFAKMQMFAGVVTVLKKYRLELDDGMPRRLKYKPHVPTSHPEGGIRLKLVKRDGWENRVFVK
ncbi:unnamed protein product [Chrysodeixis includens]|uniref:unspecific monooxygenase n=1 Tax=Chrysodeixis includens TaxID=689277 RepID=A0A9P0BPU6_CHRIL|nr:unnamed protein product [Chrysodeixis includens]